MIKIERNKNLNIYLLNINSSNFKNYLKDKYREKVIKHYIDKQKISGSIEKGMIFVYEETLPLPEWVSYLNTLSKKKDVKVSPKYLSRSVVFLTIKSPEKKTFALTFGGGSILLNPEYIVSDFGLKVSKSMLTIKEIMSMESTSIDRKIFNTKKQSSAFLIPEKILEYGSQNIVRNVYGIYKEYNKKFALGGTDSLNFKGKIKLLEDIEKWLIQFATLYYQGENNLGISDDLNIVDSQKSKILDDKLSEKILKIITSNEITGNVIHPIKISPNVNFDLEKFNGFFITGLGYKKSKVSSDFYIDSVYFFERFKRQLKPNQKDKVGILRKLKTNIIYRKNDDEGEMEPVCSIYKALNFEVKHESDESLKYILITGKWYEIDKEFYSLLKKDIDNISLPDQNNINFIPFDSKVHYKTVKKDGKLKDQLSEGKYNEDFTEKNYILMLDREDYRVDPKTMKRYHLKSQSSIELCDALYYDSDRIQFIHVKRHSGGASGTSHLLTQALVSAQAFINNNQAVINHINNVIDEFNKKNNLYNFRKLNYTNQQKEIVFAIIDKKENVKKKDNSKLLSLLEMVSLRENIRNLEHLGFKCYLKFIPGDE